MNRAKGLCIGLVLASGCYAGLAHAQQTRTVVHEREMQSEGERFDESRPRANDESQVIPWSEQLPEALRRVDNERLQPVDGPLRLRADARGQIPKQPTSLESFQTRFFPTWRWVRPAEELTLQPEARGHRVHWEPIAGACYVALAWDKALATFEERQQESDRTLAWWEAGADIDIQIRDASTDELIVEDLSRELLPKVVWCSDGSPVTVEVRLGVPADAPASVDVVWGIAVDARSLPPLRFRGGSPLAQRLLWAQSIVAPRSAARSAPAVFEAKGATLVRALVQRPAQGCELLIAVAEAGVNDLSMAFEGGREAAGDFSDSTIAAVPNCAADEGPLERTLLIGVRAGEGRIALQRFSFTP